MKELDVVFPPANCTGCSACSAVCPTQCIRMVPDEEGFLFPEIKHDICIGCNRCRKICPVCTTLAPQLSSSSTPALFAAFHKDIAEWLQSTSGGAFTAIAEEVIEHGNVVFGSAFNAAEDEVICRTAETKEELSALRQSKYIQSTMSPVYAKIEEYLNGGKLVFFSGTPCQVAGVMAYFAGNPRKELLYTCDLICHGIPSTLAWRRYKTWLEDHLGTPITGFQFRDKMKGWKNSLRSCLVKGRKIVLRGNKEDSYCQAFYLNLSLRESCYHCPFDCASRADFTLADYWGVEKKGIFSQQEMRNGISRIEVHTTRGLDFLSRMNRKLFLRPMEWDCRQASRPLRPLQRDIFYREIQKTWENVLPLLKAPLLNRMKNRLREYLPESVLNLLRRI